MVVAEKTGQLQFVEVIEQQHTAIVVLVAAIPTAHIRAEPQHTSLVVVELAKHEHIKLGKTFIERSLVQTSYTKLAGLITACREPMPAKREFPESFMVIAPPATIKPMGFMVVQLVPVRIVAEQVVDTRSEMVFSDE